MQNLQNIGQITAILPVNFIKGRPILQNYSFDANHIAWRWQKFSENLGTRQAAADDQDNFSKVSSFCE